MRADPKSQFRAPPFSQAMCGSAVVAGMSTVALLSSTETQGVVSYSLLATGVVLAVMGIRRAWHVAKRETERLR